MSGFQSYCKRKLRALGYPHFHKDIENENDAFSESVWFLENRVIRHLDVDKRKHLRNYDGSYEKVTFPKYLTEIDCPEHIVTHNLRAVKLQWLLRHATAIDYQDSEKKTFREGASVMEGRPAPATSPPTFDKKRPSSASCAKKDTRSAPTLDSNLEARRRSLTQQIAKLPIGVDLKSPRMNTAAAILRMLYVEDLRSLQREVNRTLSEIQEFTANPKTDTRLGRVGY